MTIAAYASATLSMASLQLRRLYLPTECGKAKPEAQNLGVDRTS
jgi:hypothetical protein